MNLEGCPSESEAKISHVLLLWVGWFEKLLIWFTRLKWKSEAHQVSWLWRISWLIISHAWKRHCYRRMWGRVSELVMSYNIRNVASTSV